MSTKPPDQHWQDQRRALLRDAIELVRTRPQGKRPIDVAHRLIVDVRRALEAALGERYP